MNDKDFISIKDYFIHIITEKENRYEQRFSTLDKAVDEFRSQIKNIQGEFAKKTEIASIYDLFVKGLEEVYNIKYKILLIKVAPPKYPFSKNYPIKLIGAPFCYVVRENSCIMIKEIKEIK